MIITEKKFFADTKEPSSWTGFLVENLFTKPLKNAPYIFISHKHDEQSYVYRLKSLLDNYGFTGYVDWEDDNMPKKTSGETASKLKTKIEKSSKFILIATNAAINSKWCNWEIGYADAHKYIDHIALFSLIKNNEEYTGEEYLRIYPSIQITSINEEPADYYVLYPDGKTITLRDWLKI